MESLEIVEYQGNELLLVGLVNVCERKGVDVLPWIDAQLAHDPADDLVNLCAIAQARSSASLPAAACPCSISVWVSRRV